jgi:hypothetical protein
MLVPVNAPLAFQRKRVEDANLLAQITLVNAPLAHQRKLVEGVDKSTTHHANRWNIEATMRTAFAVLALFAVANGNTAAVPEANGSPSQSTLSIYDLDVGHPNMKNLPVQEIPLP